MADSTPKKPQFVLKPFSTEFSIGWRRYAAWLMMAGLTVVCLFYGFFYAVTTPFMLKEFMAPLLPLAALAVWALPDMKTAPTQTLNRLFFAFLIMAICWPNYLAIALPGLPWITSVRLVGFPLAFVLLLCLSISPDFRAKTAASVRSIPRLATFVAAFVAAQCFSILVSSHPFESLNAVIALQISWTAIFFVACYAMLTPGHAHKWAYILWMGAVFVCLLGIWEQNLGHVPWRDHIPGFLAVGDEYVQRILAGGRRLGTFDLRIQSIHSTSLGFAEFLALATPFVIHFMVSDTYRPALRIAAGASIPLIFYLITLTQARLGAVGFFMGCLLYLLAWGFRRWRHVKGTLIGPAVVMAYPVIFVAFMAATFFVQRLKNMVWGGGAAAYSNEGRMDQLRQGIPKILARPFGYGADQGAEALGYTNLAGTLTIDNYYLLVALDYGIQGFILYYGAILMTIYAAGKYGLAAKMNDPEQSLLVPLGISLSVFFVIKSIFSQTQNHAIQFMMMGAVAALVYRAQKGAAANAPGAAVHPDSTVSPNQSVPRLTPPRWRSASFVPKR